MSVYHIRPSLTGHGWAVVRGEPDDTYNFTIAWCFTFRGARRIAKRMAKRAKEIEVFRSEDPDA